MYPVTTQHASSRFRRSCRREERRFGLGACMARERVVRKVGELAEGGFSVRPPAERRGRKNRSKRSLANVSTP